MKGTAMQAQTEFVMRSDPDSTLPRRSVPAVDPRTRQSSPACAVGLQWASSQAGCFPVKAALRVSWQAASVAARCLVTPQCRFNGLWISDNILIELGKLNTDVAVQTPPAQLR